MITVIVFRFLFFSVLFYQFESIIFLFFFFFFSAYTIRGADWDRLASDHLTNFILKCWNSTITRWRIFRLSRDLVDFVEFNIYFPSSPLFFFYFILFSNTQFLAAWPLPLPNIPKVPPLIIVNSMYSVFVLF